MSEPIAIVRLEPRPTLSVRRTVPPSGVGEFLREVFPRVIAEVVNQGARPAGPTFARFYDAGPGASDVEAGMPYDGTVRAPRWAMLSQLPGGDAARTVHVGPYETLSVEFRPHRGVAGGAGDGPRVGPVGALRGQRRGEAAGPPADRGVLAARVLEAPCGGTGSG